MHELHANKPTQEEQELASTLLALAFLSLQHAADKLPTWQASGLSAEGAISTWPVAMHSPAVPTTWGGQAWATPWVETGGERRLGQRQRRWTLSATTASPQQQRLDYILGGT